MPRPKEEVISDFLLGEVEKHKLLKRPCIVGFQGPQGSGKSYTCARIAEYLGSRDPPVRVEVFSLDGASILLIP
ncbi:uncharacterized protein MRET_2028 [Malassezia restricta]|uniref:uncharacterized protein n=1 Tax=Malassezia restricta TaxID=76775 RepID=UPI000DD16100|nr:uncharacterized protein MRET_2028 [Malassezia restricta]AXA50365.1 uncharacterized protein MRET_2028 [Malassezia restricta]